MLPGRLVRVFPALLAMAGGCAHAGTTSSRLPEDDRVAELEAEVRELRRSLSQGSLPTATTVASATPNAEPQLDAFVLDADSDAMPGDAVSSTDRTETDSPATSDARPILRLHEVRLEPVPTVTERLPLAPLPAAPAATAPLVTPATPVASAAPPSFPGAAATPATPAALEPLPSSAPVATVPAPSEPERGLTTYREGLAHLTGRRYEAAVASFSAYLRDQPGSARSDAALYFRATARYALRHYREALVDYERVLRIAPAGERASDSLYHVALCHRRLGDTARSTAALRRLRVEYPESVAARLAAREDAT